MGRWLRQTDTLIIAALFVGLFLFRFGDEAWAAVSPHLTYAQNTLTAQFERITTSLTSVDTPVEAPDVINVTSPVSHSPTTPVFTPGPRPTRIVVGPSCPGGHPHSCQY